MLPKVRNVNPRPISEVIASQERDLELQIAYTRKEHALRVRQIELNYQAAALLDGAGINLDIPEWSNMCSITIELGHRKRTKAGNAAFLHALNTIRQALGCALKVAHKRATDDGKVEVRLSPEDFPNVKVIYTESLPKGAKCRIVTERSKYKTLVCEV